MEENRQDNEGVEDISTAPYNPFVTPTPDPEPVEPENPPTPRRAAKKAGKNR